MRTTRELGVVYFTGSYDGKRIKLGRTDRELKTRLKEHRESDAFGFGVEVHPLAFVRSHSHRQDETYIKSFFSKFRIGKIGKCEVFEAHGLIPYITWLRDQPYVSTTEEEYYTSEDALVVVDSDLWLPKPERQSNRQAELTSLFPEPWGFLPERELDELTYSTPDPILTAVRECFGEIDLDPASHPCANARVRAREFYTKAQNGKTLPWHGKVWLSPDSSDIEDWVKAAREKRAQYDELIFMVPTRSQVSRYMAPFHRQLVSGVCVVYGRRSKFKDDSMADGDFIMYVGDNVDAFKKAFSRIGCCWA
jgi:hypothetical protein